MMTGSLLGALFDIFAVVLIARALQGAALGAVPLGISIMRDELPPTRVAVGIVLVSSTLGARRDRFVPDRGHRRTPQLPLAVRRRRGDRTARNTGDLVGGTESPVRSGGKFDRSAPSDCRWRGVPTARHYPGQRVGLGERAGTRTLHRIRSPVPRLGAIRAAAYPVMSLRPSHND